MSLTRSLLNDFRPLFRMIKDLFFLPPVVFPRYARTDSWQPFTALQRQAAVENEDLDVHLSSDGQSLTIEGRVHRVSQVQSATPAANEIPASAIENAGQDTV
ncbi:unnamed protein product [Rhizoctonia solani]|uniref:SHSP domain-containing protein n=1 Tax=Rhizoctonia solani TaxID=456999 RepID=A0A8H3GJF2_9AGAM|nr:unnamed protein product [Rhizoctonia solani]